MDTPIIYIEPERLAKWKKACPLRYREFIRLLEMDALCKLGELTPEELRESCKRVLSLLVYMFDNCCPTERHRQRMRRSFRQILIEAPLTDDLNPSIRQRLSEHEMFVKQGLEELDPDEITGGQ